MGPSPTKDAPKTMEELKKLLENDNKVKVAGVDIDGVLRGKIMSKDKFLSAAKSDGFGFCSVIFGWDIHDSTYSKELLVSNRANGYRDLQATIDLSTYRRLPWERNIPFFLLRFITPETGKHLEVDPRGVLADVVDKAQEKGWKCMAGAEFEYFQFKETPDSAKAKGFTNLQALTPGMHGYSLLRPTLNVDYFHDLYDKAEAFGIEVEGHRGALVEVPDTETGPGVFESALGYTDAARMGDSACLFKLLAKSVGMDYGIIPTFMAKPYTDMPGCSGHIHVSMRDDSGRNIFALSKEDKEGGKGRASAKYDDLKYISQEAEWFLGGLLEGLPSVVPLMCPNVNSYKRLLGGEAMWAPDTASYGYESRAASIRLIGPPGAPSEATRFEVRLPGADMNPYYALAAIFALGLRGIANKTPVTFGPIGSEGAKHDDLPQLPTSLDMATEVFKRKDSIAREVLGDYFVDHIAGAKEHELELHRRAVTNWEVERYLELV